MLDEIRSLMQHESRLAFLFAGVATLDELGPRWSNYFINARALRITYLRPEEAESLIRNPDPQAGFHLTHKEAVVSDILALTRCHPYLVQLVCADLVRAANARKVTHATPPVLESAVERALESGEPYFRNVWDEMTGLDPESVAAGRDLLHRMAQSPAPLPLSLEGAEKPLRRAVDHLLRLDMIEKMDGGYQFQVPLIKRWVAERSPLE